jgi:hypothetical protein
MKRSLLAATLIVAAAGVASANLLTAAPVSPQAHAATPAVPVVTEAPAEMHTSVPAAAAVISKPAPTLAPAVQKASVEMRQAPVPLVMKPRPAVNLPAVEEKAADKSKAPDATEQVAATEKGGEAAAKAAAEADGYKGVKILRRGVNGVWHASALRGQTPVMLTVGPNGSVSTD